MRSDSDIDNAGRDPQPTPLPRSKEEHLARLSVLHDVIRRGFGVLGWAEGYRGGGEKEQFEIRITVSAQAYRASQQMLFPDGPAHHVAPGTRSDRPRKHDRR